MVDGKELIDALWHGRLEVLETHSGKYFEGWIACMDYVMNFINENKEADNGSH